MTMKLWLTTFFAAAMLPVVQSQSEDTKKLLLLGETGAGKSSAGNLFSGKEVFQVGKDLDACTTSVSGEVDFLFGDAESGIRVEVTDTPGLCDPKNRDEEFLDQLADHLRSHGGAHGVVYLQDACARRLDKCARESLRSIVATLTEDGKPGNLSGRLMVLMTGSSCMDPIKRQLWDNELPKQLCSDYNVCGVQLVWYDDFNPETASLGSRLSSLLYTSWRKQFARWVQRLPIDPMAVPSESQRQKLKREHAEEMKQEAERVQGLERQIAVMEEQHSNLQSQISSRRSTFEREIQQLQRTINEMRQELDSARRQAQGCFSGSSVVVDRLLGEIPIKDLTIGSEVANSNGWVKVTTFLHWHTTEEVSGIRISHEHGLLTLTPHHLLFVLDGDDDDDIHGMKEKTEVALPAWQVTPGMSLVTMVDGRRLYSLVHSVGNEAMDGYYAPLTSSGTILVNNVLASCYTQDARFPLPHSVIHSVMAPLRFFSGSMPAEGERHPYFEYLVSTWRSETLKPYHDMAAQVWPW